MEAMEATYAYDVQLTVDVQITEMQKMQLMMHLQSVVKEVLGPAKIGYVLIHTPRVPETRH